MTIKTGIFTLLAGGVCSLAFAGSAGAGPETKGCENCDKAPDSAPTTTLRSDDSGMIIVELDDKDHGAFIGGRNGAMRQHFGDGQFIARFFGAGTESLDADEEQASTWIVSGDEPDSHPPLKPRVMLGVTLGSVSEALASQLDLDPEGVVMIESVMEGMPAERAGLRRFDIITGVDGQGNISTPVLQSLLAGKRPGDKALIKILRGGELRTVEVELTEAPDLAKHWRTFGQAEHARARAERGLVHAERAREQAERRREQAERAMMRALDRIERSRHALRARKERGDMNVEIILKELEEMDIGLDEEVMEQIKSQIRSQLGQPGESLGLQIEMPNIEFFPGEEDDEAYVLLEGDLDDLLIQRVPDAEGDETFPFPGLRGKVRIDLDASDANAPTPRMSWKNITPGADPSRNLQMSERLDSLEERMERIETLLQRLADRID